MKINDRYIGCNYTGFSYIGGINSSFNGTFKDEEVLIGSGLDYIPCVMGNVNDAYEMLKKNIKEYNANSFEEICECIYETVNTYFNGIDNVSTRMSYYKDFDDIKSEEDITRVSSLKGKGAAMCVERSMLSQNLLKSLGFNAFYKSSGIKNNDKLEVHAYNLVENDGKYYLFDSSIPTISNGKISPLITEIPKAVFNQISSPEQRIGYSIEVSHYNPLRDKDVHIVYDVNRKNIYDATNNNSRSK